jgi:WD40 repeat protein
VALNPDSALAQAQLSEAAYAPGTVRILTGNKDIVNRIVLSPDNKTLLGGVDDGSVIVWDVATGQIQWEQKVQTREAPGVENWVQDVAFSPDGQYVAATYDDRIMFWQAADGQLFREIESLVNRQKIIFNPTGDQFATIGSEERSRLVIWDFASGEILGEYQHGSNVEDFVYTADGSAILIAGKAGALFLIDARTGQVLQEFQEYTGPTPAALRNIALSPDGTRVIASAVAAGLLVWDFRTGELLHNYNYDGVLAAEFHPQDGSVLVGDYPLFRIIDLRTGAILRTNIGHDRGILSIAVTADGSRAFTASVDESIRVWDLYSGQIVRRFAGPSAPTGEVAFSPDGRTVLAGSKDGTATLWDVETGEDFHHFAIDQPINSVAFSPDGQTALIGAGYEDVQVIASGRLILWDVEAGAEIRRFEGQPYAVSAVAFNPDGRLAVSVGHGAMAILWDVETGSEIRRFEDYWVDSPYGIEAYTDVAFSPDGKQIYASHDDGNIIGWDVESGQEIRQLVGHQNGATGITFSNDGLQLVSGGTDSQVILWNMQTGSLQQRLVQASGMNQLMFSPDGTLLLGGKITGVTSLLQVETGDVIRRYFGFAESLSFSPDGRHAVVGYRNGAVELWRIDLTVEEFLTWTQNNRYIPELTCEQRDLYRIEPPCELEP